MSVSYLSPRAPEPGSMEAMLEAQIPMLRRYARSIVRNQSDADDLVQDCLEKAIARWSQRRPDSDLRAWLLTIIHNLHISHWRMWRRRGGDHLPIDEWSSSASSTAADPLAVRDILGAMDKLAQDHRTVLFLVGVEGLGYEQAAAVLGVPVGTVMSRLSRAREKLRIEMDAPRAMRSIP